ncbi:MAG: transporter substrate-binding domain-containing protein [Litoreibacter sp.]|nr:transporter substrate-binding domain-containing protein [Litoreibacter sp.]
MKSISLTPFLALHWGLIIWLGCMAMPSAAQDQDFAPTPMAWSDLFPWFYHGEDGELTGFGADLAREIGKEVGFEIEPFYVGSFPQWGRAQTDGTSAIMPAVAKLPNLAGTNLFSKPVMTTEVRLAVTPQTAATFDPSDLSGKRVGVLVPGAGSDPALLPGAILVSYSNLDTALVGLLSGEIDALSAEAVFVYGAARRAGLRSRITFVGAPLQTIERHVAVHQSRPELLGPINDAIDAIKSDGRFENLLSKHQVSLPEPVPDVLRVGIFDLEPYMMVEADGGATGFAVEVLKDLADLSGLELVFVPIRMEGLTPGATHDIIPAISITPERAEIMDFSYPIEASEFSIFMRAGEATEVTGLSELQDRRVGIYSASFVKKLTQTAGIETLVEFTDDGDPRAILEALTNGQIDAFLFENSFMRKAISNAEMDEQVVEVFPPFHVSQRAIGLRFGLSEVRDRLNVAIPTYLITDDYRALREEYFGEPVFWTRTRVLLTLLCGVFIALIGVLFAFFARLQGLKKTALAIVHDAT